MVNRRHKKNTTQRKLSVGVPCAPLPTPSSPYHTRTDSSPALSSSAETPLSAQVPPPPSPSRNDESVLLSLSSCCLYWRNCRNAFVFSSSGRSSNVPWTRLRLRWPPVL